MWRAVSFGSTIYNKIGEVQLQSDDQVTRGSNNFLETNIILTGNNTIEIQSGDVVGYYHPPQPHYQIRDISINGYEFYWFDGSPASSLVDLRESDAMFNSRQPLLQFTIGIKTAYWSYSY